MTLQSRTHVRNLTASHSSFPDRIFSPSHPLLNNSATQAMPKKQTNDTNDSPITNCPTSNVITSTPITNVESSDVTKHPPIRGSDATKDPVSAETGEHDEDDEALDGGWGWVVVLAVSFMHFMVGGLERSYGIVYLALLEKYGSTAALTAWIGPFKSGIRLVLGIPVAYLVHRYGVRKVTCVGGLIHFVGVSLTFFAPQIWVCYITFGIITGIGDALVYSPAFVILGQYFNKRRGTATGLAVAGSGLGTFTYPPVTTVLLDTFGVSGTFLILGGFGLNLVLCGLLYRPADVSKALRRISKNRKRGVEGQGESAKPLINENGDGMVIDVWNETGSRKMGVDESANGLESETKLTDRTTHLIDNFKDNRAIERARGKSTHLVPEGLVNTVDRLTANEGGSTGMTDSELENVKPRRRTNTAPSNSKSQAHFKDNPSNSNLLTPKSSNEGIVYLSLPHLVPEQSTDGKMKENHRTFGKSEASLVEAYTALSRTDLHVGKSPEEEKKKITKLDFSMLRSLEFMLFSLNVSLATMGFGTFLTLYVAIAKENGIPQEKAAFLLSIIGICDFISRMLSGYLLDHPKIRSWRPNVWRCVVFACGVLALGVPWLRHYYEFCLVSVLFGMCSGTYITQRPVICGDLCGTENMGSAFGIVIFFQGLGFFVGTPVAGAFRDYFGNYSYSFYFAAALYMSGAVISLSERLITHVFCRHHDNDKSNPGD